MDLILNSAIQIRNVHNNKVLYIKKNRDRLNPTTDNFMRNALSLLTLAALVATLTSGCTGTEEKMGRGIRDTTEVVRLGDAQRSVEQTSVWDGPLAGSTTGVVIGVDKSLERTGLGIVEIITAPFPPYKPIFTKYVSAEPVYPDGYVPGPPDESLFRTDIYYGFTGGEAADFIPGSRFDVFDH